MDHHMHDNMTSMDNDTMHDMEDGMHDMHGMDGMMHMMRMTFYFGNTISTGLLFDSWHVTDDLELIGAIIAVFFMAFFYDGFKTLREFLVVWDMKNNAEYMNPTPSPMEKRMEAAGGQPKKKNRFVSSFLLYFQWLHILQSVLAVVQTGWAYLLMLVAMTYNAWLFLAICVGAGAGYFVFARFRLMRPCNSACQDHSELETSCH